MPRVTRSWLPSGAFHITVRGNRRQTIFRTTRDAQKLLKLIEDVSPHWELKTYCLMPNHFHLVVVASIENLTKAMRRINSVYAQWFNRKYDLSGHVFQGRFESKPIEDEKHLYEAIRYVLLNPVRAGLCRHPSEWPWCNWSEQDGYVRELVDDALRAARTRDEAR
jgi:putative transposase